MEQKKLIYDRLLIFSTTTGFRKLVAAWIFRERERGREIEKREVCVCTYDRLKGGWTVVEGPGKV